VCLNNVLVYVSDDSNKNWHDRNNSSDENSGIVIIKLKLTYVAKTKTQEF